MSRVIALSDAPGCDELAKAVDAMKGQLLIVLVNRLGGSIELPVSEIDATGGWVLEMTVDDGARTFSFNTVRKT